MPSDLKDFPFEITEPIKALDDKRRREIVLTLLRKESCSYSEIRSILDIKKGTLNHHLNVLVSSGLIRNFSFDNPTAPYSSYYAITDFGHKFLTGIRQALEPHQFQIGTLIDTANASRSENPNQYPSPTSASWREETANQMRTSRSNHRK